MSNASEMISGMLIDSSIKSLLVFIAVLIVLFFLHMRKSVHSHVHAAHRVWVFLIVSMLLIPILSLALPGLSVPIPMLSYNSAKANSTSTSPSELAPELRKDDSLHGQTGALTETLTKRIDESNRPKGIDESEFGQENHPAENLPQPITGVTFRSDSVVVPIETAKSKSMPWHLVFTMAWATVCGLFITKMLVAKVWTLGLLRRTNTIAWSEDVANARVVESEEVDSPAVSGLFSHTIILPISWRAWDNEKRRAVIAHELAHVDRRDGLVVFLAQLNVALFWFNPISWIAKAKVNRLAELACDQQAVLETGDRLGYAKQLVEIAAAKIGKKFQPGISMAAKYGISERIEMLLDTTRPFTRKASRIFVGTLLLIGVPTLLVIAAVQPSSGDQRTGAEKAAQDWIRFEDGKTILTFRGEIVDADGKPAVNPQIRSEDLINLKVTGNEFEFDVVLENWHMPGVNLIAESEDKNRVAVFSIFSRAMRASASQFHRLTLKPTISFDFKVVHEGNPISDAKVTATADAQSFTATGVTNIDGVVTLNFPNDSRLENVLAWNDQRMIGGYFFNGDPIRDPKLPLHEIELGNCIDQKIRLVDSGTGKPLAGFKFKSEGNVPRYIVDEMYTLVTDEKGEAIDCWFPDGDAADLYIELDREFEYGQGWSKSGDGEPELVDGVFVCEFEQPEGLRRLPYTGQLIFPDGVDVAKNGLKVELRSFQHPEEGRGDAVSCRTDVNGNFTAEVIPGATYRIAVDDAKWASKSWSGILAGPGSERFLPHNIEIFEGEPVSVAVTEGPDKRPIANQLIGFRSSHTFEWLEDGELKSGTSGLDWWVATDQNGIAHTTAAPGELSARIYNSDWRPREKFRIRKGKPNSFEFHREIAGKRMIRGQLQLESDDAKDFTGTEVKLKPIDGETRSEEAVTADKDGNFSCEVAGSQVGGYAKIDNGKSFASFIISDFNESKSVKVLPGVPYRGQVVDAYNEPVKGTELQLKVFLREKEDSNKVNPYFDIDTLLATTDDQGQFEFLVPPNMPFRLYYQESPGVDTDDNLRFWGSRFLTPGEDRPPIVVKIGEKTFEQRINVCRLNHTRHLFVIGGDGIPVPKFLDTVLNEDVKDNRSLYWYGITIIDLYGNSVLESKKFWRPYVSEFPRENEVVFLVFGGDGKKISSLKVDASEAGSIAKVAKFVEANRISDVDAQKALDDALTLAESTGRKVWLQFSQTRSDPCIQLSRWIDKHKAVLEKAFVFIKVDDVRDKNRRKIWKKYVGKRSIDIPFSVVLDAEGAALEKSVDAQGSNIGFPSSLEGRQAFRRIFNATAKGKLSPEEIDALVKSLE